MTNYSVFVAAVRAGAFSLIFGGWIWLMISPGCAAIIFAWFDTHKRLMISKASTGRSLAVHEQIAGQFANTLSAHITWLDLASLAGVLAMFFHLAHWFFQWLEKRALKEKNNA